MARFRKLHILEAPSADLSFRPFKDEKEWYSFSEVVAASELNEDVIARKARYWEVDISGPIPYETALALAYPSPRATDFPRLPEKDGLPHGRLNTYATHGCRCIHCRNAMRIYQQKRRKQLR
jgi:hypothetical protein